MAHSTERRHMQNNASWTKQPNFQLHTPSTTAAQPNRLARQHPNETWAWSWPTTWKPTSKWQPPARKQSAPSDDSGHNPTIQSFQINRLNRLGSSTCNSTKQPRMSRTFNEDPTWDSEQIIPLQLPYSESGKAVEHSTKRSHHRKHSPRLQANDRSPPYRQLSLLLLSLHKLLSLLITCISCKYSISIFLQTH